MSSPTELEYSFSWQESPSQGEAYLEINPEAAAVDAVVYEVIRQAVRTASLGRVLPGEDPTALISDAQIRERVFNYRSDVMFVEQEQGTVVKAKLNVLLSRVPETGEVLDVVKDDAWKLSMKLIDGKLVFNRRVFDANYGPTASIHVMRTAMMALDMNPQPVS